tara:strand:- start:1365 stop:4472 length:3108 start_codon:yes stop_codon:yes gene_type:complete
MGENALPDNVHRTYYDSGLGIQEFQFSNDRTTYYDGSKHVKGVAGAHGPYTGLKVVVKNDDFQGSATHFNLIVDCGSRNEKLNQLGGAHLLEHACFLGLGGSPTGDVKQYFWSSQGARDNNNAFTTVNAINYSCETEPQHYDKVLETLQQMLSGANLEKLQDGKYLSQEIQNVISEHERSNSAASSARRTVVTANSMVNTALGLNNAGATIGVQSVYSKMKAQDLRDLHRQMFCPSRATLVVCGLQDAAGDFMNKVARTLGTIPINMNKAPLQQPRRDILPSMNAGQRMQLIESGNAATYLAMAVPYPSMVQGTHQERATAYAQRVSLDVLHELVLPAHSPQSGLLKPLFDQGLVYDGSFMSAQSGYASPAVMLLAIPSDVRTEPQRVASVQSAVQYLLQTHLPNFSSSQDHSKLLQSAKARLKSQDEQMTQGNMGAISEALLQGVRFRDPAYFFKRKNNLDYVTPEAVQSVAKMWDSNRVSMVVHSQHDGGKQFESSQAPGAIDDVWAANPAVQNQAQTLQAKDTTRENAYNSTNVSTFANMIAPLQLKSGSTTTNNVTVLDRDIRPIGLTEVRVSYPDLAQRNDNHEQIAVTCDAINRQINEAMQETMGPESHVRLQASPTATALHVIMQVRGEHAAQAVKHLKETLLNAEAVVPTQKLDMLVSSHMALGRGNAQTDARGWAENMTMQAVFNNNKVLGFTTPNHEERLAQLSDLSQQVDVVQQNLRLMGSEAKASHAHVINDINNQVSKAVVLHMKPTGASPHDALGALPMPTPTYGAAGMRARDMGNTPELMVHAAVPLEKVKIAQLKDDMRLRVCCETLNASLGNSFAGRLMRTMRAENGLTYGTTSALLFGEMLNDQAHPCLYFTATLKPDQFTKGIKLMQDTVREALVLGDAGKAKDVANASSAKDEFNFAQTSLKTHWTRSSMARDVASALLTSKQMRETNYDERAKLLGVNGGLEAKPLSFEQYKDCITSILPENENHLSMYVSVVGTNASGVLDSYKQSLATEHKASLSSQLPGTDRATLKLRFRL